MQDRYSKNDKKQEMPCELASPAGMKMKRTHLLRYYLFFAAITAPAESARIVHAAMIPISAVAGAAGVVGAAAGASVAGASVAGASVTAGAAREATVVVESSH